MKDPISPHDGSTLTEPPPGRGDALRVLLIDCTETPPEECAKDPLAFLEGWFRNRLAPIPGVAMQCVGASSEALEEAIDGADAVLISGSPRDAFEDDAFTLRFVEILQKLLAGSKPVLGVCYGHQIMARAAGGAVIRNPEGWELGDCMIELTPEGQRSPLFAGMPPSFLSKESHQDIVGELPPGAQLLATNRHTRCQAIAYRENAYSVQFHPEFTPDILRHLWKERRVQVRSRLNFDADERLDSLVETPAAARLFQHFLQNIPKP